MSIEKIKNQYSKLSISELDTGNPYQSIIDILPDRPYSALFALAFASMENRSNVEYGYELVSTAFYNNENTLREEYPDIADEYEKIINSDEIDGRIFRDTEHNFDKLLDQARTELDFDPEEHDENKRTYFLNFLTKRNFSELIKIKNKEYY